MQLSVNQVIMQSKQVMEIAQTTVFVQSGYEQIKELWPVSFARWIMSVTEIKYDSRAIYSDSIPISLAEWMVINEKFMRMPEHGRQLLIHTYEGFRNQKMNVEVNCTNDEIRCVLVSSFEKQGEANIWADWVQRLLRLLQYHTELPGSDFGQKYPEKLIAVLFPRSNVPDSRSEISARNYKDEHKLNSLTTVLAKSACNLLSGTHQVDDARFDAAALNP
ncbi:hypothetical protein T265_02695 [Opisthorchis viverrini]|uniref:Uncharacterized protein n=1 Tax=Opisthorchis viverrini TaxID=6198 RepID=A0A075A5W3_OPIVI|nr:hypothetical protein T265_02695 [Opisthorchis viverrini]KER31020.1 hypothetical protein T265_02695 [Opisthorchis viverrini]